MPNLWVSRPAHPGDAVPPEGEEAQPLDASKVMRIGTMVHSVLEELRGVELGAAGRAHLVDAHRRVTEELERSLPPELASELDRLRLHLDGETPGADELRVAHAQLLGWLEGLLQGVRMAVAMHEHTRLASLTGQDGEQSQQEALPEGNYL